MAAPPYHGDARSVDAVLQSTLKLHRHVNSNVNPGNTPSSTTSLPHPFQYQQHQSPEPRLRHGSSGEIMATRPVLGPGPSAGSSSAIGAANSTIHTLKKQLSQQQPLSQPPPTLMQPSSLPQQQPQVGLGLGLVLMGQGPSSQGVDGPSANGGGAMTGVGAGTETGITSAPSSSAAMTRSLSSSSWGHGPPASPRSSTVASGMLPSNSTRAPSPHLPNASSEAPSSPSSSPGSPVLAVFPSPSIARQPSIGKFVPLRDNTPQPQPISSSTMAVETLGLPLSDDQTQPQQSTSLSLSSETIKAQREHAQEAVTATTNVGHQCSGTNSVTAPSSASSSSSSSSSSAGKAPLTTSSSTLPLPPPSLPLVPPQSMPGLGSQNTPARHIPPQSQSSQQSVSNGTGVRSIKTSLGSGRAGLDEILRARQASQKPTITVWVRYVAKDVWVSVEIPREMPVNKARDLALTKCQLTTTTTTTTTTITTTPSAPTSLAGSIPVEEDSPPAPCASASTLTVATAVANHLTATSSGAVAVSGTSKKTTTDAEGETVEPSAVVVQSESDAGNSSNNCARTLTVTTTTSLAPSRSDEPSFEEKPYPLATVSPPVSSSSASKLPVTYSIDSSSSSTSPSQNKGSSSTKANKAASFDESQLQQQTSKKGQTRSASKKPSRSGQGTVTAGSSGSQKAEKEPSRLFRSQGNSGDRRSSETSLGVDEDEERKRKAAMLQAAAEAVATRWDIFSDGLNGYGEEASRSNYERIGKTGLPARSSVGNHGGKIKHEGEGGARQGHDGSQPSTTTKKAQQLKRLLSNSSMHYDDGANGQSCGPSGSGQDQQQTTGGAQDRNNSITKEGGRLGSMSSWYPWRDRDLGNTHHVNKQSPLERELAGYLGEALMIEGPDSSSSALATAEDAVTERERGWRALFGLFWRSAGHWLDDSRPMSSYTIKSNDVLELQLRSHFIPLPPITSPDYFSHYAEGILFKLSKKSRPKSMLTGNTGHGGGSGAHGHGGVGGGSIGSSNSKESMGVWKERWVVLQGTKLLIYHKRKDTAKKTIDISLPVQVSTSMLPPNTRHMFKFTTSSSSSSMSSTMLSLDVSSEASVPKVYFRGASEHDITQWNRIFNALGGGNVDGQHGMRSPGLIGSNGFLVGSPIPGSLGTASLDLATSSLVSGINTTGYSSERRRNHTAHSAFSPTSIGSSVPKVVYGINPVVISNVAAALSNFNSQNSTGASIGNSGSQLHHPQPQQASGQQSASQKPLSGTTREDIRRRAITEPNQFRLLNPQQPPVPPLPQALPQTQSRGHAKHLSKASAPELEASGMMSRSVDVSNVSEAPFRLDSPPGRKRKPVLGTEYLDNASQRLLVTSSARSSMMPMYSGYVWLYIPGSTEREDCHREATVTHNNNNNNEKGRKLSVEEIQRARLRSLKTRSEPEQETSLLCNVSPDSPNSLRSISLGGSPSKSSGKGGQAGRYVKCFVAINDQGHFQWVEVKKQAELGQQEQQQQGIDGSPTSTASSSSPSSRSGYGFQLRTSPPGSAVQPMTFIKSDEKSARNGRAESPNGEMQAFKCHKLSLFFFCIRVPKTVIARAMVDMSINLTRPRPISPSFNRSSTLGSSLVVPGLVSALPTPNGSIGPGMISPGSPFPHALSPTNGNSTPTPMTPPTVTPKASVATKARHRLSASLSSLATAALPPLPNFKSVISPSSFSSANSLSAAAVTPSPGYGAMSFKGSPHSSPGATTAFSNKSPPTWPSFTTAQLQEKRYSEKPPPPPLASAFSSPSQQSQLSNQQISSAFQTSTESVMNMPPRATTMTHRGSSGSLRTGPGVAPGLLITTLPPPSTLFSSPPPLTSSSSSSSSAMTGLRPVARMGGNDDLAIISPTSTGNVSSPSTSSMISPMLTTPLMAPATTPPTSAPTATTPLSNVVSLAQSLQKAAMKSRKMSVSSNGSSSGGSHSPSGTLDGQQGVAIVVATHDERSPTSSVSETQQQQQPGQESLPWTMTSPKPRMTIFEATLAKNASIPDSAATLEQNKILMQQQRTHVPMMQLQQAAEIQDASPSRVEKNIQDEGKRLARDCPFFSNLDEREEESDAPSWVVLKGYTETEEEWKLLQSALERFLDAPVSDNTIALPPEDTMIPVYNVSHPSYDCPPSERDKKLWNAVQEARNAAAAAAVVGSGEETNEWHSPSEHEEPGKKGSVSAGAVAQIRATGVSLTRWMNLSGSSNSSGYSSGSIGGEKEKSDRTKKISGVSHRSGHSSTSLQGGNAATDQPLLGKGSSGNLSSRHGSEISDNAFGGSSNGTIVPVPYSGTPAPSTTSTPTPLSDASIGQYSGSRLGPGPNAISIQTVHRAASPALAANVLAPQPRLNAQRSADGFSRATSSSLGTHPHSSLGYAGRATERTIGLAPIVGPGPNHYESQSPIQEPTGPSQGSIYSTSTATVSEGCDEVDGNDVQGRRLLSIGTTCASIPGLGLGSTDEDEHLGKGLQQSLRRGSPWSPVPVSPQDMNQLNTRSMTVASSAEELSGGDGRKELGNHIRFGPGIGTNSGEDFYGVGSSFGRRNNVLDDYRAMSLSSSTKAPSGGSLGVNTQNPPGPRSMSLTAVTTMSPSIMASQYHPFTSRPGDKETRVKEKERDTEKSTKSKEKQGRDSNKQHFRRTSRSSVYSLNSPLSSTPPVILQESTPPSSGNVGYQDPLLGIPLVPGMMAMTDEYGRLSHQPVIRHGMTEDVAVMAPSSSNGGSKAGGGSGSKGGETQKRSMFGASKAAVSGVFGKLRKSVA